MLQQYADAKKDCPANSILLFRMGDFFEMFFEDARTAAKELELTLTSRDKNAADPIPMAGVPHHAVDGYIARLVSKGYTVAICDQVEDPKQAKGLVRRAITRLVTPGTISDLQALDPVSPSYTAAVVRVGPRYVVGLLELLAGEVLVTVCTRESLLDECRRMSVREVLLPDSMDIAELQPVFRAAEISVRSWPIRPSTASCNDWENTLAAEDQAAGELAVVMLRDFAEHTQRRSLKHLQPVQVYRQGDALVIDDATRRNLELTQTVLGARRKGSLIWHLDRCQTAMGSRLLLQWLLFPLRVKQTIENRLDAVEMLKANDNLRENLGDALAGVRDVERLLGRVAVGRANPKDLALLRDSLIKLPKIQEVLRHGSGRLSEKWQNLDDVADLRQELVGALVVDPPALTHEGGIFARGHHADLDGLLDLCSDGHDVLAEMEQRERKRSGIQTLKVRFNKVFGYYIEVTKAHLHAVPSDYVRKQTLVGAERFITEELKAYEEKVLVADEQRHRLENELFGVLLDKIVAATHRLRVVSRLIAETDALLALANVAYEGRYVRPRIAEETILDLRGCRHPIVERLLPAGERFVPNHIYLDADKRRLAIVTGPNMAGKSTVMRQAAISLILAHMGSFVPAVQATVGLADRVFTRVGAADDLGRGQSTFMVEMLETAAILKHATRDSFVLLDEIGRGTSTYDGVSIAWAVAEALHTQVGCRAFFATHYHELIELADTLAGVVNLSVAVKEHQGRVVFLRQLVEGPTDRSYGLHVAELAGIPKSVLERARQVLLELDERDPSAPGQASRETASMQPVALDIASGDLVEVVRMLRHVDPLRTTPMDALTLLQRLKQLVGE